MNLNDTSDAFVAETSAKHDAAIARRRAAEAKFREALTELRESIAGEIATQAYYCALCDARRGLSFADAKTNAVWWVINVAAQNRAQWSGGPESPSNVIESLQREEALAWLSRR